MKINSGYIYVSQNANLSTIVASKRDKSRYQMFHVSFILSSRKSKKKRAVEMEQTLLTYFPNCNRTVEHGQVTVEEIDMERSEFIGVKSREIFENVALQHSVKMYDFSILIKQVLNKLNKKSIRVNRLNSLEYLIFRSKDHYYYYIFPRLKI